MLSDELRVQIRHWFYAEHWRVGTIAQQLGVHPDAVRHALETEQFNPAKTEPLCACTPMKWFRASKWELLPLAMPQS
ncbi:MAG: hypothetical protein DMG39_10095 [Acidobacteria bacterium]|nr:MAG: hypothetical protein DMG39_10095 [Acidobacteriota bacterium]